MLAPMSAARFGWSHAVAWALVIFIGQIQYIVVKKTLPIISPREAVQAAIASGRQR
jgi:hypothetical protein